MVGMCSLLEFDSVEENVRLCSELGLDFVELNMNFPYCLPEKLDADYINELKCKYDISFTVHLPEEIDFGAFCEATNEAGIKIYRQVCSFAKKTGIKIINTHIHNGIYITLPNEKVWLYEHYQKEYLETLCKSFDKLINISKANGVKLCIENTTFNNHNEKVFTALAQKKIYFTWDIGHDASNSYRAERFYKTVMKKVAHFHIHDYDGISDHQTLFSGILDIKGHIDYASNNGKTAVIEVKTAAELEKSVAKLRDRKII